MMEGRRGCEKIKNHFLQPGHWSKEGSRGCGPYSIAMGQLIFIVYTVPISVDTF